MSVHSEVANLLAQKLKSVEPRTRIKTAPPSTELLQNCTIDLTTVDPSCFTHSGIICSIGPSCRDVRTLEKMMEAGMTICRLNISHGTHSEHEETISNIRQAEINYSNNLGYKYPVAIALDTKGPEMRTGRLEGGPKAKLRLKKGEQFKLSSDKAYADKGSYATVFIDYDLSKVVKPGKIIFLDHGRITLEVSSTGPANVITNVAIGGELGSNKSIKLDALEVELPKVSDRDKADLQFAVKNYVDIIMASYVNNADMMDQIRAVLGSHGRQIMVIAKIQTKEALRNIKQICDAADGVMICRNDLVLELLYIEVFHAQKIIIAYCHKIKKPVICSSEVLDSMTKLYRPTLNEIADISACLTDGVDCVVLTSATSVSVDPVESVKSMKSIFIQSDHVLWQGGIYEALKMQAPKPLNLAETVALMAVEESILCLAAAIIIITSSGRSAQLISKYKPRCPLIVVTKYAKVARQCNLYRGIISLEYPGEKMSNWKDEVDARLAFALQFAQEEGFVALNDPIILVTGWLCGPSFANTIRAVYVCESKSDNV